MTRLTVKRDTSRYFVAYERPGRDAVQCFIYDVNISMKLFNALEHAVIGKASMPEIYAIIKFIEDHKDEVRYI